MDANAAAAKETKEKEGSTANSQERNEEEFTKDNVEIHNKIETATETTQWQRDHGKAMDARRGANKKGHNSIVIRCSESSWMDRRILAIPGPPHDDRHLL